MCAIIQWLILDAYVVQILDAEWSVCYDLIIHDTGELERNNQNACDDNVFRRVF